MKNIVWLKPDGSVAITILSENHQDVDQHQHELELQKRGDIPADWTCVGHDSPIPDDRAFRNAWVWDGGITPDMEKCRAIQRDRIRYERRPLFAKYDCEWMKYTAKGNLALAAAAEAKRQELRDAPAFPAIDSATTPEELKRAVPSILDEKI